MIGVLKRPGRARQLVRFDGMVLDRKCFTDLDAVMDYDGRAWLVFEVKHGGKDVPTVKRLAIERFVSDTAAAGKMALAAVVEHSVSDVGIDVFLRDCNVREVYLSGEFVWRPPKKRMTAKQLMNEYIGYVEKGGGR